MTLAAQTNPSGGDGSNAQVATPGGTERDQAALAALSRMGEFLRSLRAFVVRGEATTDEILDTGQKVQLAQAIELRVRRPDRLRASVESDRKQREYFYDGNTFTLYSPRTGYYAEFHAPKTIGELIEIAERRYGIEMPLVDLFRWGSDENDATSVRAAIYLGPSRIGGIDTEHYAYRAEDVDFQVWIERGDRPLPRKLVITTTSEPSQPQHAMTFSWNLDAVPPEADFTFVPSKDSKRIVFEVTEP
ncbi:MAG TPA: DUF2092 domain-containing protein [Polyangiaceae bacterium]